VNLKPAAGRVNVSVQLREPAQIQLSILRRDPSLKRDPARAYPLAGLALTTPRRTGLLPSPSPARWSSSAGSRPCMPNWISWAGGGA